MSLEKEGFTLKKDNNELMSFLDAYESEIRINIIVLLLINQELSLGEIANFLKKSKPTITRHVQILIDLGLVKVYNKDEVQRGNIKRNYYSLDKEMSELFDFTKLTKLQTKNTQERIELIYDYNQSIYLLLGRMTEFINAFGKNLKFLVDNQTETADLNKILEKKMPKVNFRMYSAKQFSRFEKIFKKFLDEIKEIESEEDDSEKPFMFLDLIFPVKELIQLERKIE